MGFASPAGLSADAANAAIDAGVRAFRTTECRREITICQVPRNTNAPRIARIAMLLAHALADALGPAPPRSPGPLPVVLALPDLGPRGEDDEPQLVEAIQNELRERTGVEAIIAPDAIIRRGRASIFYALQTAQQRLRVTDAPMVLVVAADSTTDSQTLRKLYRDDVVLSAGGREGRIPGEAAVCILLARPQTHPGLEPLADVRALATDRDPASFSEIRAGRAPNHAHGLTRVFAELRRQWDAPTELVCSAQTGERSWAREFTCAYLRNPEIFPEPLVFDAIGSRIGDAGAAAGAAALARAVAGFRPPSLMSQPAKRSALVFGESDDGWLGGCVLTPAG